MEDFGVSHLVFELLQAKKQTDSVLAEMRFRAEEIHEYYLPANRFKRWRDSQEGKLWKKQKWQKQNCCCSICKQEIPLLGSHIDHIKPISRYPELAVDTRNLQIACPTCNTSKGNRE